MRVPGVPIAFVPVLAGALGLLATTGLQAASPSVGRRFPPEKRTITDAVTGATLTVLTSDPANDSKPYQTHPTWTADGKWILFRSDRAGSGPQAFLVSEQAGDIIQLTEGPGTATGSLNLSRKANRLFYMRGGDGSPRQLVQLELDPLIADTLSGRSGNAAAYERVVATLPGELRDSGGFALDADETKAYWGVAWGEPPARPAQPIDRQNTDPAQGRQANRERFEAASRGTGGIRSIDLRTGEVTKVIDVAFRMGHVQANPWVPGEIVYCHETTGDAPQRVWTVKADGTGNRPLYVETPDEWVTHETVAGADEVMFNVLGHLPYLRERPTGLAVINLRSGHVTMLGQVDEEVAGGGTGGLWHGNGSPDGRWAVADTFKGDIHLIDRRRGERTLLTTGHQMRPDHAHPIFSPDSKRVLIQSGRLTDGASLDLIVVDVPDYGPKGGAIR